VSELIYAFAVIAVISACTAIWLLVGLVVLHRLDQRVKRNTTNGHGKQRSAPWLG